MALYLLGHNRIAHPKSTFFFHDVRTITDTGGVVTLTDLENFEEHREQMEREGREVYEAWLSGIRSAQHWMARFMRERTDTDTGTFLQLMHDEVRLTAREAQRYGIVHSISEYTDRPQFAFLKEDA